MKTASGPLLQIPDNDALADDVTAQEMFDVYQDCLKYKQPPPPKSTSP